MTEPCGCLPCQVKRVCLQKATTVMGSNSPALEGRGHRNRGSPGPELSRETLNLLLASPKGAPATPAEVDVLADTRAEVRIWSRNTRRAYAAG